MLFVITYFYVFLFAGIPVLKERFGGTVLKKRFGLSTGVSIFKGDIALGYGVFLYCAGITVLECRGEFGCTGIAVLDNRFLQCGWRWVAVRHGGVLQTASVAIH